MVAVHKIDWKSWKNASKNILSFMFELRKITILLFKRSSRQRMYI